MPVTQPPNRDAAILGRLVGPPEPVLTPAAARALLAIDFSPADRTRMRALSAKARAGTLTADEQAEINSYERVGHLLNIVQSKARLALRGRRGDNGTPKPH